VPEAWRSLLFEANARRFGHGFDCLASESSDAARSIGKHVWRRKRGISNGVSVIGSNAESITVTLCRAESVTNAESDAIAELRRFVVPTM
jgi:hypothetical protein